MRALLAGLLLFAPSVSYAQQAAHRMPASELVRGWRDLGPAYAKRGEVRIECPPADAWQQELFNGLLAISFGDVEYQVWGYTRDFLAFRQQTCRDEESLQWLFREFDRAESAGLHPGSLTLFIGHLSTLRDDPRVAAKLLQLAADHTRPEELRSSAAFDLTTSDSVTDQLRTYLDLFELRSLPWEYGFAIADKLTDELGLRFFEEVAQRVRGNPVLAAQAAMIEIAGDANGHSSGARRVIADALDRAAERRPGLSARERAMIDSARAITRPTGR